MLNYTGEAPVDAPEYLKEAAEMMERTNYTREERELADLYRRAHMKRASEDAYVREEGIEIGQEKGIEIGIVKVAKNMIAMGLSLEDVAKASGLTIDAIKELQQQE